MDDLIHILKSNLFQVTSVLAGAFAAILLTGTDNNLLDIGVLLLCCQLI